MADWRRAVLKAIGAPVTPQNLKFLSNWQRWEGGHTHNTAKFNWLNTTRGTGESINSVGVKRFSDFQTGVRYTAETLMNGRYDDIMKAFRSGNPYAGTDMSRGLQVWVSGRPDGNPEYAQKVMGGGAAPKAALPQGGRGPKGNPGLAAPPSSPAMPTPPSLPELPDDFLFEVWGNLAPLFKQMRASRRKAMKPPPARSVMSAGPQAQAQPTRANGKSILMPLNTHGTHVTDGLGWGTKTAEDIMASPGTAVQAPMGGVILTWNPTGAQGGGSMLIRLDNGREYWLGHIANGLKAGTRFKKGAILARISADHRDPHLHIDDGQ